MLELQPDHISAYSLIVEERTRLWKLVEIGRVVVPGEDIVGRAVRAGADAAGRGGLPAVRDLELDAHRAVPPQPGLLARRGLPGLRPRRGGLLGQPPLHTIRRPAEYVRRLGVGETPIRDAEWIDRATAMGEFLMLGLRLNEGVALDEFARRFGQPFEAVFGPTAAQLREWGLLEGNNGAGGCVLPSGASSGQRGLRAVFAGLIHFRFWIFDFGMAR